MTLDDETLWANSILLIVSIAFSLGAIEAGLRYFKPHALTSKLLLPPNLDRRLTTDEFETRVRTNRLGFRSGHELRDNSTDTWRIVVIGDSYTFGWGVDNADTFPAVLERTLRDRGGRTVEVVNAGRPGDGLADYLATLHEHVLRLRPNDVIVGYLSGNDCPVGSPTTHLSGRLIQSRIAKISADARSPQKHVRSYLGRLVTARIADPVRRWARPRFGIGEAGQGIVSDPLTGAGNPMNPSRITARLRDHPPARKRYQALSKDGWSAKAEQWQVSPWLVQNAIFYPRFSARALFLDPEFRSAMKSQWAVCEGLLREMAAVTTKAGARFHLLVLASAYQVDPRVLDVRRQLGFSFPDSALTDWTTENSIKKFCDRERLDCFYTLAAAREAVTAGERLYYPIDGHPNAAGYALFAEKAAAGMERYIGD